MISELLSKLRRREEVAEGWLTQRSANGLKNEKKSYSVFLPYSGSKGDKITLQDRL